MKLRKPAKQLSLRERFLAMSMIDRLSANEMMAALNAVAVIIDLQVDDDVTELGIDLEIAIVIAFINIIVEPDLIIRRPINLHHTIDTFSQSDY